MNKKQLADSIAARTGLSRTEAARVVDGIFDAITTALQRGETVRIGGFGTFTAGSRAAHVGRNPRTGRPVTIAAAVRPRFKPSQALRDAVSGAQQQEQQQQQQQEQQQQQRVDDDKDDDKDDGWGGPRVRR